MKPCKQDIFIGGMLLIAVIILNTGRHRWHVLGNSAMLNGQHATMLSTAYRPGGGRLPVFAKGFLRPHSNEKHLDSFFLR